MPESDLQIVGLRQGYCKQTALQAVGGHPPKSGMLPCTCPNQHPAGTINYHKSSDKEKGFIHALTTLPVLVLDSFTFLNLVSKAVTCDQVGSEADFSHRKGSPKSVHMPTLPFEVSASRHADTRITSSPTKGRDRGACNPLLKLRHLCKAKCELRPLTGGDIRNMLGRVERVAIPLTAKLLEKRYGFALPLSDLRQLKFVCNRDTGPL